MIEWSVSTLTRFCAKIIIGIHLKMIQRNAKKTYPASADVQKIEKDWRASPYSWIQSATLNKNHLSLHNQQLREFPSFWLDGHPPPSGNHTILLLERIVEIYSTGSQKSNSGDCYRRVQWTWMTNLFLNSWECDVWSKIQNLAIHRQFIHFQTI